MSRWHYHDVALVVGLAVLGEDIVDISVKLKRTPEDVRDALSAARMRLCRGCRAQLNFELARAAERAERELFQPHAPVERTYSVAADVDHRISQRRSDLTAELMGDPSPERSALNLKQSSNTLNGVSDHG